MVAAQRETPFISPKPLDYVEIHKVNKDGALSLLLKQKENGDQTGKAGTPETSKEYAKVSRVMDNNILVLVQDPGAQNVALFEESTKEAPPSPSQNQAEKDLSSFSTAPSDCRLQQGGWITWILHVSCTPFIDSLTHGMIGSNVISFQVTLQSPRNMVY